MSLATVPNVPIFTTYCIDYRYDALSSDFLRNIGFANAYYLATNAGAGLPLDYHKTCATYRHGKNCCNGGESMHSLQRIFSCQLTDCFDSQTDPDGFGTESSRLWRDSCFFAMQRLPSCWRNGQSKRNLCACKHSHSCERLCSPQISQDVHRARGD